MRNRKGFTLIELLIVIVIIGILVAVFVPKYQDSQGRKTQTADSVKAIDSVSAMNDARRDSALAVDTLKQVK